MRFRAMTFIAGIVLAATCASSTSAQVAASITGTVTDPSGAPISAAAMTAKNLETGLSRSSATDDAGRYAILALAVGRYEVTAAKPGFQNATRIGIHLAVAQEARIDLTLQVGTIETQIHVHHRNPNPREL